jgi:hypothetical protein
LRIVAQDGIWTLNGGGILAATWTNPDNSHVPVSFVLKGNNIKMTGDPGATGGVPVVCFFSFGLDPSDLRLVSAFSNFSLCISDGYDDL